MNKWDDTPLEKDVEKRFREKVKKLGGKSYKWQSENNRSVPDRIVTWPGGIVHFVELKREGKKATPKQKEKHDELRAMGCTVFVLAGDKEVEEYLEFCFVEILDGLI